MKKIRQWWQKLKNYNAAQEIGSAPPQPNFPGASTINAPTDIQIKAVEEAVNNVFDDEFGACAAVIYRQPEGFLEQLISPFVQLQVSHSVLVDLVLRVYPDRVLILGIVVDKHCRGKLYPTRLFDEIQLYTKVVGIKKLYVEEVGDDSIKFWLKKGFKPRIDNPYTLDRFFF